MSKSLSVNKIAGKSGLARLMAIENLAVVHDPREKTASFDIGNRVLKLPVLKDMTGYIYDWFIAHEVSHALYTEKSVEKIKKDIGDIPFSLFNITEDIRIEKLIKRRYPGTVIDSINFYKDLLVGRDFFGIGKKDPNKFNLADKVNIHYKAGAHYNLTWTPEEQAIIDYCDTIETHEDAIEAAKRILDFMDKNGQTPEQDNEGEGGEGDGEGEGDADGDGDGDAEGGNKQGKSGSSKKEPKNISKTQAAFDKNFKDKMTDGSKGSSSVLNMPSVSEKEFNRNVYPLAKVAAHLDRNLDGAKISPAERVKTYIEFFNTVKPVINMMTTRFNMKKAADEYNKITLSKTGKIDFTNIAQYKFREDMFLRSEVVPMTQNHGLIMMVDWSGSIESVLPSIMKQTLILVEFCRKQNIPYVVYAFSDGSTSYASNDIGDRNSDSFTTNGHLIELFNSNQKKSAHVKHAGNVLKAVSRKNPGYIESLSSTPLTHAAHMVKYAVENFQATYKRQKVAVVTLTDGSPTDELYYSNNAKSLHVVDKTHLKHMSFKREIPAWKTIMAHTSDYFGKDFKSIGIYIDGNNSVDSRLGYMVVGDYLKKPLKAGGYSKDVADNGYARMPPQRGFDEFFYVVSGGLSLNSSGDTSIESLVKAKKSMLFLKFFIDAIA